MGEKNMLFNEKSECSGCYACYNLCPTKSILMLKDAEGFCYPNIDLKRCSRCGLCERVCKNISTKSENTIKKALACTNCNDTIRMESSSGGIFTVIAEHIINQGGTVCGAAFIENRYVKHICVRTKEELSLLRGSKYLQSEIGDVFQEIKVLLEHNKLVLFTGTPCQIKGLLVYLKKPYINLICQDIICHGAPSPKVWEAYIGSMEHILKKKVDQYNSVSFRNKEKGWKNYQLVIPFLDYKYTKIYKNDLFMQAFLMNLSLRPSCYHCKTKSLNRDSDITLADFWGIEKFHPECFDDKGTSLVFINTNKGEKLLEEVMHDIKAKEVTVENAVKHNVSAYEPVSIPEKREYFFKNLDKMTYDRLINKIVKGPLWKRIYHKGIRLLVKKQHFKKDKMIELETK